MKKIPLTQGKFALVDDEDYEWLNQWKWFAHNRRGYYYAARTENGKTISMHREILGLKHGNKQDSDHINHNTLDNCRLNLRICSRTQNTMNQISLCGTSKYKGVCWHKRDKKWFAQIQVCGKHKFLGNFKLEMEAAKAYDKATKKYFGEFAHTNFNRKSA